jgi:hypothetical protein
MGVGSVIVLVCGVWQYLSHITGVGYSLSRLGAVVVRSSIARVITNYTIYTTTLTAKGIKEHRKD